MCAHMCVRVCVRVRMLVRGAVDYSALHFLDCICAYLIHISASTLRIHTRIYKALCPGKVVLPGAVPALGFATLTI